jgi:hypothetical protein
MQALIGTALESSAALVANQDVKVKLAREDLTRLLARRGPVMDGAPCEQVGKRRRSDVTPSLVHSLGVALNNELHGNAALELAEDEKQHEHLKAHHRLLERILTAAGV